MIIYFFKLAALAVASVVLVAALFFYLFKPLWKNGERANIIFDTKPLILLSLDNYNKSLSVIVIPDDAVFDVVQNYGQYRASKIYDLDVLEKKGGKLFARTISSSLDLPIDGYVHTINTDLQIDKIDDFNLNKFLKVRSRLFNIIKYSNSTTNLDFVSYLNAWKFVMGISADKINFINLAGSSMLESTKLPDNSFVLMADYLRTDSVLKEWFYEQSLTAENIKIEVLNNTDKPGLAQKAANLITHIGGSVINTANFEEKTNQCVMYINNKSNIKSYTGWRLKNIFDCQIKDGIFENSRADITVLLGEN